MKTLSLWPTLIYVFDDFLSTKEYHEIDQYDLIDQEYVKFIDLEKRIIEAITESFSREVNEQNLTPEITEIWSNIKKTGETIPPHMHANNDVSGIFYLNPSCFTNFLDPRIQGLTNDLGFNQPIAKIKGKPNKCVLFPSWLTHWVDQNSQSNARKTISFNVKFRGKIGKPNSFTEVIV